MASNVEKAWTAGMIDADGCITLQRSKHGMAKPLVVVDNTDIEILHELQRLYGGALVTKRKAKDHHRQCWSWRMYGADKILALLKQVVPFMRCRIKLDRARLLLTRYKELTPRNGQYTDKMRRERLKMETNFMSIGAGRGSQCRVPGA